jgi:hypothetical protein
MTPNIGAGGNAGIESAAALANAVKWLVEKSNGQCPGTELVEEALQRYQKQREVRAGTMVHSAGEVTRMQAGKSLYHRLAARIVRLYPGDFIADYLSGYFSGAVMLASKCYTVAATNIISRICHHQMHLSEGISRSIQRRDGQAVKAESRELSWLYPFS